VRGTGAPVVGFLGVGNIGGAVALRLLASGHSVLVYDKDPSRVEDIVSAGGSAMDSACQLGAKVDLVLVALPDPAAIEEAVLDVDRGVLSTLRRGATLIDFSTNPVALTRRVGDRCRERGVAVLDAPMTQSRGTVAEGRAVIMAGGDPAVLTRWRPLLALVAEHIIETGPHGSGTTTKLITQYIGLANIVTALEGFLIAAAAGGLDLRQLREAISLSAADSFAALLAWQMATTRPFEAVGSADGTLGLHRKDIEQVLALAAELGVSHRMGIGLREAFTVAARAGLEGENFTAILRALEEVSGTRIPIASNESD
jgi:3-hydroxyisobutyrate dehydrogenase